MKKRHEMTETWFYKRILKRPWTEHAINGEVLKKMDLFIFLTAYKIFAGYLKPEKYF